MSFRSALLASAVLGSTGAAFAADLPARTAPAPYIAAQIFTWTGFYVGLNAGGGWNNGNGGISTNVNTAVNPIYGGGSSSHDGFTGGVQAGYNMQFGSWVAGVEADINYLDRKVSGSGSFPTAPAGAGTDFVVNRTGGDNNWFGTVRGRLGYAFDRFLIFGTGGLAFGGNNHGASVSQRNFSALTVGAPFSLNGSGDDNSNIGWALGAGGEYAFTNSISFKVEYLHVALGNNHSSSFTTASGAPLNPGYGGGQVINVSDRNRFDIVRAGVNFRF